MSVASEQTDDLRQALIERKEQLAREIEEGAQLRLEEDRFANIAGEVADPGDASTATEQADLRNAQIERDVLEMRSIDAALERLENGGYGICTRCGGEIAIARLRANPAAERCIDCQAAYEKQFAGTSTPSL
jgi:DnaK suppressor protein